MRGVASLCIVVLEDLLLNRATFVSFSDAREGRDMDINDGDGDDGGGGVGCIICARVFAYMCVLCLHKCVRVCAGVCVRVCVCARAYVRVRVCVCARVSLTEMLEYLVQTAPDSSVGVV